ncbi:proline hydroxylase [Aurantiacibacter marinus]|uniref:Proline hydroxylase n=1 Tax=Aurantiacibacter marinus TaxID=874156 RepID=A0A0H0XRB3_9SPHN|nr:proline hydroxylase [Aurantiacibacter marinus]
MDAAALAGEYARTGRVTIAPFVQPDQAQALYQLLRERTDWQQVINSGADKIFEFDRTAQAGLDAPQKEALDQAVYAGARHDFQFRYETLRVPDDDTVRAASDDLVFAFARFLSHGPARELLRFITGDAAIAFADAQATAYAPGDFLTRHDDDVAGKHRSAAYVMSLNPQWRIEWGGLFLMHDADGHGADAIVPGFNRLNLFAVPQMHSVSEVTRATPYRRYSVTGWLRRSEQR